MKKLFSILLSVMIIGIACSKPVGETGIRVISEEYPPFNYTDGTGNFTGTATALVKAIMKKLDVNIPIEVMAWDKAYELVQKEPDVALYSMARLPQREHLFMWVGPVGSYENWLYARKGSGVKVNSLEEARCVRKIAAVKDEAGQIRLAEQGFINFEYTPTTVDGLKKLVAGEVDLWLGSNADLELVAKKAGVSADDLEPVVFVHKLDLFIAFNKNTPFAVVDSWQKALDSIQQSR
jgi:polar amino acid transport system substrate-binding protein